MKTKLNPQLKGFSLLIVFQKKCSFSFLKGYRTLELKIAWVKISIFKYNFERTVNELFSLSDKLNKENIQIQNEKMKLIHEKRNLYLFYVN